MQRIFRMKGKKKGNRAKKKELKDNLKKAKASAMIVKGCLNTRHNRKRPVATACFNYFNLFVAFSLMKEVFRMCRA